MASRFISLDSQHQVDLSVRPTFGSAASVESSNTYNFFSWFCHFDDDQYVNVLALEDKLRRFDSNGDWYLGKPSIERPLEILDRDSPKMQVTHQIDFMISATMIDWLQLIIGLSVFRRKSRSGLLLEELASV